MRLVLRKKNCQWWVGCTTNLRTRHATKIGRQRRAYHDLGASGDGQTTGIHCTTNNLLDFQWSVVVQSFHKFCSSSVLFFFFFMMQHYHYFPTSAHNVHLVPPLLRHSATHPSSLVAFSVFISHTISCTSSLMIIFPFSYRNTYPFPFHLQQ